MRLLVTRPEPDGEETAERLATMGHEVVVDPMLRIVFAAPPGDLVTPAAIVATSRNGVRALAAWPAARNWRDTPLFVTGRATAETGTEAGFTDVRAGDGDAAALADLVARDLGGTKGPILYVAAHDRSGGLGERLTAGGFDLRTVEAYRAEMATALDVKVADAFRSGSIDGVLFFSRRTAQAFAAIVNSAGLIGAMRGLAFYALSDRVAEPLREVADARIRVAARPDFDSLAALIVSESGG